MTLMTALNTVSDVQQSLSDVAEEAERIAAQIAGTVPSNASTTGEKRISDSITESLNERAEALQDPVHRIRGALARISRSIGA
ncbi:hypothetical protein ASF36_14065 [Methylobacterium sp. Leaf90]|nr:hypothetical protein ASF36_14065 [Methylobacterium sp. Leaf90]